MTVLQYRGCKPRGAIYAMRSIAEERSAAQSKAKRDGEGTGPIWPRGCPATTVTRDRPGCNDDEIARNGVLGR